MNAEPFSFDVLFEGLKCGVSDWNNIWGDPWVTGTTLVLAYAVTAMMIFRVARASLGRERWLWMLCGFLFAFQVFNTPLDLHAMIFTIGRCLAHAQGWYEGRREIQSMFLIGAVFVILLFIILACFIFRANLLRNLLLIMGVMTAVGFTVLKGTSYHYLEPLYNNQIGLFYGADLVELMGVCLAFVAAAWRIVSQRSKGESRP